ncbi:hypothetical protein PR048_010794, partial [Dryococelus australis]
MVIRHANIAVRSPESTSVARARGFDHQQVFRFYDHLWELIEKHNLEASHIFNMGETGIKTKANKPSKILSMTGKKKVCIIVRRLLDSALPDCQASCTDNGRINAKVFLQWPQFFVEKIIPILERKFLLIRDNHESHKHTKVLDLSFAPHMSHKMQSLDIAVYGPLKMVFLTGNLHLQKYYPGRLVNQYDIAKLFPPAYLRLVYFDHKEFGPIIIIFSLVLIMLQLLLQIIQTLNVHQIFGMVFSETTSLPAFVPVHLNCDSTSDVCSGQSTTLSLPASLIIIPDPGSSTDQNLKLVLVTHHHVGEKPPKSRYSPLDIHLPPVAYRAQADKCRSKRECQQSEVLASTPVREQQGEKFDKKCKEVGNVSRNRNTRFSEVLASTPVREQQGEKLDKKCKEVGNVSRNRNTRFSEVLASTPVREQQGEKLDKKCKEVGNVSRNRNTRFSEETARKVVVMARIPTFLVLNDCTQENKDNSKEISPDDKNAASPDDFVLKEVAHPVPDTVENSEECP